MTVGAKFRDHFADLRGGFAAVDLVSVGVGVVHSVLRLGLGVVSYCRDVASSVPSVRTNAILSLCV